MSNSNVKYRSIAFGTWDVGDARKVVEEKYYGFRNKKDGCSMSVDNSTPSTPTTSATNTLSGYTSSSTPTSNESTSTKSFEDCLSSSETIATSSNSRLDKSVDITNKQELVQSPILCSLTPTLLNTSTSTLSSKAANYFKSMIDSGVMFTNSSSPEGDCYSSSEYLKYIQKKYQTPDDNGNNVLKKATYLNKSLDTIYQYSINSELTPSSVNNNSSSTTSSTNGKATLYGINKNLVSSHYSYQQPSNYNSYNNNFTSNNLHPHKMSKQREPHQMEDALNNYNCYDVSASYTNGVSSNHVRNSNYRGDEMMVIPPCHHHPPLLMKRRTKSVEYTCNYAVNNGNCCNDSSCSSQPHVTSYMGDKMDMSWKGKGAKSKKHSSANNSALKSTKNFFHKIFTTSTMPKKWKRSSSVKKDHKCSEEVILPDQWMNMSAMTTIIGYEPNCQYENDQKMARNYNSLDYKKKDSISTYYHETNITLPISYKINVQDTDSKKYESSDKSPCDSCYNTTENDSVVTEEDIQEDVIDAPVTSEDLLGLQAITGKKNYVMVEDFKNWSEIFQHLKKELLLMKEKDVRILNNLKKTEKEMKLVQERLY